MEERRGLRQIGGSSELGNLGVVGLSGKEGEVDILGGLTGGVEIISRYVQGGMVAVGIERGEVEVGLNMVGRKLVLVIGATL